MDLNLAKSKLIEFLIRSDMFATLALVSMISIQVKNDLKYPAYITLVPGKIPVITLDQRVLDIDDHALVLMILYHELRHIPQLAELGPKAYTRLTYPPEVVSEEQQKYIASKTMNIGMDMALHEDMQKLFPNIREKFLLLFQGFFRTVPKEGDIMGCFVPEDWERNKDWVFYTNEIIKRQSDNNQFDERECLDLHDFECADSEGEWQRVWERAKAQGKIIAHSAGRAMGGESLSLGQAQLQQHISESIRKIKTKIMRINAPFADSEYSWSRINKLYPDRGLPGKISVPRQIPQVVVVVDVSGSMCSPEILNQLRPAVALLEKRRLLARAYACDVEIRPLTSTVIGGGGTELNGYHIEKIRKDIGLGKIAVVYVTDTYCDLSEVQRDKDVELHVVDVHSRHYVAKGFGRSSDRNGGG